MPPLVKQFVPPFTSLQELLVLRRMVLHTFVPVVTDIESVWTGDGDDVIHEVG